MRTMLPSIAQLSPRKRGRSKTTRRSEPGKGLSFLDQMTNLRTLQLVQLLRRVMRLPLGFCVPRTCHGRRNAHMTSEADECEQRQKRGGT